MNIPPPMPRSRSFTRFTMRVGLEHLGQSVLLVVSIIFLRSAVLAIFAMRWNSIPISRAAFVVPCCPKSRCTCWTSTTRPNIATLLFYIRPARPVDFNIRMLDFQDHSFVAMRPYIRHFQESIVFLSASECAGGLPCAIVLLH